MPTYRKKPVEVQAIQWTGDNAADLESFAGSAFEVLDQPSGDDPDATASILASQHSTWVLVYTGDWIIRELDGNGFYPCRSDIFDATFEPAGVPA